VKFILKIFKLKQNFMNVFKNGSLCKILLHDIVKATTVLHICIFPSLVFNKLNDKDEYIATMHYDI
jgi:hypothetical protein